MLSGLQTMYVDIFNTEKVFNKEFNNYYQILTLVIFRVHLTASTCEQI